MRARAPEPKGARGKNTKQRELYKFLILSASNAWIVCCALLGISFPFSSFTKESQTVCLKRGQLPSSVLRRPYVRTNANVRSVRSRFIFGAVCISRKSFSLILDHWDWGATQQSSFMHCVSVCLPTHSHCHVPCMYCILTFMYVPVCVACMCAALLVHCLHGSQYCLSLTPVSHPRPVLCRVDLCCLHTCCS